MNLLGLIDEAFALVDESADALVHSAGIGGITNMLWLPEMAAMRADPRFGAVVSGVHLPDYWKEHGPPDNWTPAGAV